MMNKIIHVFIMFFSDFSGSDRPTLRQLHEVLDIVAPKWHELAMELLDEAAHVKVIEADYRGDVRACCSKMFQHWLERDYNASWKKLISILKRPHLETALNTLALTLEKKCIGKLMLIRKTL